jgi:hypothetical protein
MANLAVTTVRLVAFIVALTTCVAASAQPQGQSDWLLVIQGQVIDASADELTLSGSPNGIAFTDRPERLVRVFDVPALVHAAWSPDGSFRQDPPNASLIATGETLATIVEIVDATQSSDDLSFTIHILEGDAPAIGDSVALTVDYTAVNAEFTIP